MKTIQLTKLFALLLLLGHTTIASAVGLLLPAVQRVYESPGADPLVVDIDRLGVFEAGAVRFEQPILDFALTGDDDFDVVPGRPTIVVAELQSLRLTGKNPVSVDGDSFDVFLELSASAPVLPIDFNFELTSLSSDGESAQGQYDSVFDIFLEVTLVNVLDRTDVETFIHDDTIHVFGSWHSMGRQLVFDDLMQVDGVIKGSLTTVPVPASLWLMMTGVISLVALSRRKLQSATSV